MKSTLPVIMGVGKFKSEEQFKNINSTPERNVTCYELELFCKNSGCCTVNDKKHPIKKGSILFSLPGDVRCTKLHTECLFVHFMCTDENLVSILNELPKFISDSLYEDFDFLFTDIRNSISQSTPSSKALASAKLIELICKIEQLSKTVPLNSDTETDSPIIKGIRYMNTHYKQNVKVDDIAAHSNLSASHFYKLFLEQQGITPNQYLTNLRITKAKELLLSSPKQLPQIAEECGFSSQAYFCYSFKKNVGVTPSEFKMSFINSDTDNYTNSLNNSLSTNQNGNSTGTEKSDKTVKKTVNSTHGKRKTANKNTAKTSKPPLKSSLPTSAENNSSEPSPAEPTQLNHAMPSYLL